MARSQASPHVREAVRQAALTPEQRMAELEEAGQAMGEEFHQLEDQISGVHSEAILDSSESNAGSGSENEQAPGGVDAGGESAEERAARLEIELAAAQAAAAPAAEPEPAAAPPAIPADDIQTESAESSDPAPEQADPAPPESEAGQSNTEQEEAGPRITRKRR